MSSQNHSTADKMQLPLYNENESSPRTSYTALDSSDTPRTSYNTMPTPTETPTEQPSDKEIKPPYFESPRGVLILIGVCLMAFGISLSIIFGSTSSSTIQYQNILIYNMSWCFLMSIISFLWKLCWGDFEKDTTNVVVPWLLETAFQYQVMVLVFSLSWYSEIVDCGSRPSAPSNVSQTSVSPI